MTKGLHEGKPVEWVAVSPPGLETPAKSDFPCLSSGGLSAIFAMRIVTDAPIIHFRCKVSSGARRER